MTPIARTRWPFLRRAATSSPSTASASWTETDLVLNNWTRRRWASEVTRELALGLRRRAHRIPVISPVLTSGVFFKSRPPPHRTKALDARGDNLGVQCAGTAEGSPSVS